MRRPITLAALLAAGLAAGAGGCAPNPIIARDPVAVPAIDAVHACGSRPLLFGFYDSTCERVNVPAQPVVRARG